LQNQRDELGSVDYKVALQDWEKWVAEGKQYSLYALVGKNAEHDIYYLFFILAPNESFETYEQDYLKWLDSIEALE